MKVGCLLCVHCEASSMGGTEGSGAFLVEAMRNKKLMQTLSMVEKELIPVSHRRENWSNIETERGCPDAGSACHAEIVVDLVARNVTSIFMVISTEKSTSQFGSGERQNFVTHSVDACGGKIVRDTTLVMARVAYF